MAQPRNMRVLVITIGSAQAGSTRFRIMQYQSMLESKGARIDFVEQNACDKNIFDRVRSADVVINQKCLLKRSLARFIAKESRYLVFDFDDAIYTRPGKPYRFFTKWRIESRFRYWLQASHLVTVANGYLAAEARKHTSRVEVVPMAIDLQQWQKRNREPSDVFRLGWVGAPNNLVHLERLSPVLKDIMRRYPQVRLMVFSGKKPNLDCPFEYTPFSPNGEIDFIQQLDVGLLPLTNEEYSRGKSPIKAIQYLACGVPVVGNVYGATREICNPMNSIAVAHPEQWVEAIARLVNDRTLAQEMGSTGRQHVMNHHCLQRVGLRLCDLILK